MVVHIVMWKITDSHDGLSKAEIIRKLKNDIDALKNKVPGVVKIEAGVNFCTRPIAYDLALYSEFATEADLAVYQDHPDHVLVKEYIGKVATQAAVVDYNR